MVADCCRPPKLCNLEHNVNILQGGTFCFFFWTCFSLLFFPPFFGLCHHNHVTHSPSPNSSLPSSLHLLHFLHTPIHFCQAASSLLRWTQIHNKCSPLWLPRRGCILSTLPILNTGTHPVSWYLPWTTVSLINHLARDTTVSLLSYLCALNLWNKKHLCVVPTFKVIIFQQSRCKRA